LVDYATNCHIQVPKIQHRQKSFVAKNLPKTPSKNLLKIQQKPSKNPLKIHDKNLS
jgi:hypothetical protein